MGLTRRTICTERKEVGIMTAGEFIDYFVVELFYYGNINAWIYLGIFQLTLMYIASQLGKLAAYKWRTRRSR